MTDRAPKFMPEPRGYKRKFAALYVGVGPTKFDEMVEDGRKIWDRFGLDAAFDELPSEDEANPWDEDRS